ncbi:MAG TPA: hypothetical protein VK502_01055 [Candidatus Saccharimonadales bacterium]|nr:hypothetical protein [Candidatus Saccharimonadales bacterium]
MKQEKQPSPKQLKSNSGEYQRHSNIWDKARIEALEKLPFTDFVVAVSSYLHQRAGVDTINVKLNDIFLSDEKLRLLGSVTIQDATHEGNSEIVLRYHWSRLKPGQKGTSDNGSKAILYDYTGDERSGLYYAEDQTGILHRRQRPKSVKPPTTEQMEFMRSRVIEALMLNEASESPVSEGRQQTVGAVAVRTANSKFL